MVLTSETVGDHVGPEQHDQRQEGGDEEHHRHGERQAVATPVHPEEDASHRQQAEARKHETLAAIDQTGPDPLTIRKRCAPGPARPAPRRTR